MHIFVQALILGLLIGGVYALLASGLTLIFGVMDVINVAQGALMILAAFFAWALWKQAGIDPLLGALVTTPAMFLVGYAIVVATNASGRQRVGTTVDVDTQASANAETEGLGSSSATGIQTAT